MGHFCRICGCILPNERFSGKGHKVHICKKCFALPAEQRRFIEEENEIAGFLSQSNISKKNLFRLKRLAASKNEEIAELANIVLEIGEVHPRKRKRFQFLTRKRKNLLRKLDETGLIYSCDWMY